MPIIIYKTKRAEKLVLKQTFTIYVSKGNAKIFPFEAIIEVDVNQSA
jgi:hypothetical protein